jgi:hypothetical protein
MRRAAQNSVFVGTEHYRFGARAGFSPGDYSRPAKRVVAIAVSRKGLLGAGELRGSTEGGIGDGGADVGFSCDSQVRSRLGCA